MISCPACDGSLTDFEAEPGAHLQLCSGCRGMLVAPATLAHLVGNLDWHELTEPRGALGGVGACAGCGINSWQSRALRGSTGAGLASCTSCGSTWLVAGELQRLRRAVTHARARAALPSEPRAVPEPVLRASDDPLPPPAAPDPARPFGRIDFDRGLGNVLALPGALTLALLFCATDIGRFLGALVGMPFHELGHAVASWLGSRFAVPLPFFTIWSTEQSVLFGGLVAGLVGWFGFHSWREHSRFGVSLAAIVLAAQLGISWIASPHASEMIQILGGALGEIALGGLVLAAFHFPLPDRLRWDFWRWPALLPAAICFAHALLLWTRALEDTSQIPWGSAVGSEADGDMNRLVRDHGWTARTLVTFYFSASVVALLGLGAAYGVALRRRWVALRA